MLFLRLHRRAQAGRVIIITSARQNVTYFNFNRLCGGLLPRRGRKVKGRVGGALRLDWTEMKLYFGTKYRYCCVSLPRQFTPAWHGTYIQPKLVAFRAADAALHRTQVRRRMAQDTAKAIATNTGFVLQLLHASSRDQLYMGTICFILLASLGPQKVTPLSGRRRA
jgi:hypothetical protein